MLDQPRVERTTGPSSGWFGRNADLLPRLGLPIATWAAIVSLALHPVDPLSAGEDRFLALLAGLLLVAAAAISPSLRELGWGSLLTVAVAWTLPAVPARGAMVLAVLATVLAIAAGRRAAAAPHAGLPFGVVLGLAFGVQFLFRGELLYLPIAGLQPARTAVALFALPVAAALAVALLGKILGWKRALLAAGAAALLGAGWNVASTLSLVSLAAAALASDLRTRRASNAMPPGRPWLQRLATLWWLPLVGLVLPVLWEPRAGFVTAACGLILVLPGRPRILLAGVVAVGAYLAPLAFHAAIAPGPLQAAGGAPPAGLPPALTAISWLLVLLPTIVRTRQPSLAIGAALLALAAPWLPDRAVLAGPIALAAFSLEEEGVVATLQALWLGALLVASGLMAAYPWLRSDPLGAALSWSGLSPGWSLTAVVVTGIGLSAAWGSRFGRARLPSLPLAAGAVLAAILALLNVRSWPRQDLLRQVTPLSQQRPLWHSALPPTVGRRLVIDSALTNASGLTTGTVVAAVELEGRNGERLWWPLRAGEGTGEWSARRPDVALTAQLVSPPAWCSWIDDGFFAQRYRATWTLPTALDIESISIARSTNLPAEADLALYQVAIGR